MRRIATMVGVSAVLVGALTGCTRAGGTESPEQGDQSDLRVTQLDSPNGKLVCVSSSWANDSGIWCEEKK